MNLFQKKIIGINLLFIILVSIFMMALYRNEKKAEVFIPVLEEEIFTGDVGTSSPVRISIPKVAIEAKVVPVGRAKSGNMAVPKNYEDVGWYRHGPVPGSVGNAVLAGHLDNGSGKSAVFFNLKEVRIGDFVYIDLEDGKKAKFAVKEIRLVDYQNPPLEDIFGPSPKERLNLITCDGTWDESLKTYDKRLVVFTERVAE